MNNTVITLNNNLIQGILLWIIVGWSPKPSTSVDAVKENKRKCKNALQWRPAESTHVSIVDLHGFRFPAILAIGVPPLPHPLCEHMCVVVGCDQVDLLFVHPRDVL